jgi:putative endonuclease
MYLVYALRSITENYMYVGMTENVERRLLEHNRGNVRSTRPHRPFRVIYTEMQPTRIAARLREKYWKSGTGKEQLKLIQ